MKVCTFFIYGIHIFDPPKAKTVSMHLYKNACKVPASCNSDTVGSCRAGTNTVDCCPTSVGVKMTDCTIRSAGTMDNGAKTQQLYEADPAGGTSRPLAYATNGCRF